ncbi:hypothetical protein D4741_20555, partial [Pseudoalteromonas gelatinilytica]
DRFHGFALSLFRPKTGEFSSRGEKLFIPAALKTFALRPLTGSLGGVSVLLTKRQKIIPFGTTSARRTKN